MAKTIKWKDRVAHKRMKLTPKRKTSNETNLFSTPPAPVKKRIRLLRKVKSTTVVPEHLSSQIANFKRKVRKLIKSGVHVSSPDGCTLPSTPKQIGELLLEGTHIDKKAFQAGIQILREDNLFKRDVLYKWRNKAKTQSLNPQKKVCTR